MSLMQNRLYRQNRQNEESQNEEDAASISDDQLVASISSFKRQLPEPSA